MASLSRICGFVFVLLYTIFPVVHSSVIECKQVVARHFNTIVTAPYIENGTYNGQPLYQTPWVLRVESESSDAHFYDHQSGSANRSIKWDSTTRMWLLGVEWFFCPMAQLTDCTQGHWYIFCTDLSEQCAVSGNATVQITTCSPTASPTQHPSSGPSNEPSIFPTLEPTTEPTTEPTWNPTEEPTSNPTLEPTQNPTDLVESPVFLTDLVVVIGGMLIVTCCVLAFCTLYVCRNERKKTDGLLRPNKKEKEVVNEVEIESMSAANVDFVSPVSQSISYDDDMVFDCMDIEGLETKEGDPEEYESEHANHGVKSFDDQSVTMMGNWDSDDSDKYRCCELQEGVATEEGSGRVNRGSSDESGNDVMVRDYQSAETIMGACDE